MRLKANIERVRKQRGLSQRELAARLGVGQGAYSNYINRNEDISVERLQQIANALDVSIVDLLEERHLLYADDLILQNAIGVLAIVDDLTKSTYMPTKAEALQAVKIAILHDIREKLH